MLRRASAEALSRKEYPVKRLYVFSHILLCSLVLSLLGAASVHAEEIRIGAVASLTGQAGEQGKNWMNGARLAVDELALKGVPVKLSVEDDASNPAKAVSAFRKMVDFDHVQGVLGGTWDFLAEALIPLAKSSKLPFITMTNPLEILSEEAKGNPYIFTNALSLKATEEAVRAFLRVKRPNSIAILAPAFPFTQAHADLVKRLAKELSIPVVYETVFSYDDYFQTLKVLATKTVQSRAELVFLFVSSQSLDPFLLTMFQQKGAATVLCTQHLDAAFQTTSNRAAYKNVYGVYPKVMDSDFARRYQAKFGESPKVYSAEGYDALMFLALSLSKGLSLSDPQAQFRYEGVTGTYTLPVGSPQLGDIHATIMTTRNGRFEEAAEFSARATPEPSPTTSEASALP